MRGCLHNAIVQMARDAREFYGDGVVLLLCLRCNGIFPRPPEQPPDEPARECEECIQATFEGT